MSWPSRRIAGVVLLGLALVLVGCGEDVFALDAEQIEPCSGSYGQTWYVRQDGGDSERCTGLTDATDPGSGLHQDCAFSHPFYALPPGGEPLLQPGDRLIIAPHEYQMGLGAPGTELSDVCDPDFPWMCTAPPIPSGEDEDQPTCILGAGWDEECSEPEVLLFAFGGARHVLSLEHAEHVHVECLRITDLSDCIADHFGMQCPEEPPELAESPVGHTGIVAGPATGITLKNVHVQGMPADGIRGTEELADWTLEDVQVQYNGHSGIRFDADGEYEAISWGDFNLTRVISSWNGCNEPLEELDLPDTCWGIDGDGLNAELSAAEWSIEESDFSHNTGAGLRIARHESDGATIIDRLRAEGNAGVQLDITGEADITNALLIGNCDFFSLTEPPYEEVTGCADEGPVVHLRMLDGSTVALVNSTVYGRGAALLTASPGDDLCEETTFVSLNSIFYGAEVDPTPSLLEDWDCQAINTEIGYSIIHGLDPDCEDLDGIWGNLCDPPGFDEPDPGSIDLYLELEPELEGPCIDNGLSLDDEDLIPELDYRGVPRPQGAGVDRGAFEVLQ